MILLSLYRVTQWWRRPLVNFVFFLTDLRPGRSKNRLFPGKPQDIKFLWSWLCEQSWPQTILKYSAGRCLCGRNWLWMPRPVETWARPWNNPGIEEDGMGSSETVKVLATKPDGPISILGVHTTKGITHSCKLWASACMSWHLSGCSHMNVTCSKLVDNGIQSSIVCCLSCLACLCFYVWNLFLMRNLKFISPANYFYLSIKVETQYHVL